MGIDEFKERNITIEYIEFSKKAMHEPIKSLEEINPKEVELNPIVYLNRYTSTLTFADNNNPSITNHFRIANVTDLGTVMYKNNLGDTDYTKRRFIQIKILLKKINQYESLYIYATSPKKKEVEEFYNQLINCIPFSDNLSWSYTQSDITSAKVEATVVDNLMMSLKDVDDLDDTETYYTTVKDKKFHKYLSKTCYFYKNLEIIPESNKFKENYQILRIH